MTKKQTYFVVVSAVWANTGKCGPQKKRAHVVKARNYDHASEVAEKLGFIDPWGSGERHAWFTWPASKDPSLSMAPALVRRAIAAIT